jgi:hypothetical protein
MQAHDFQEQLHAGFPDEPIDASGAFADWGRTYPDATTYKEQLDGKRWSELDRAYIVQRSDALGFLGTSHLVAVLPIYLASMVEDGTSSPATGMLTLILTKPRSGEDTGLGHVRFDALVEALTGEQKRAVAQALDALARHDPEGSLGRSAIGALEALWNHYLPPGLQQGQPR